MKPTRRRPRPPRTGIRGRTEAYSTDYHMYKHQYEIAEKGTPPGRGRTHKPKVTRKPKRRTIKKQTA